MPAIVTLLGNVALCNTEAVMIVDYDQLQYIPLCPVGDTPLDDDNTCPVCRLTWLWDTLAPHTYDELDRAFTAHTCTDKEGLTMKLTNVHVASHRNGVTGEGFHACTFNSDNRNMVAIVFDTPGQCAVLDVSLLAEGNITFSENSWRGDWFEDDLRKAISEYENGRAP
jgi:hypothetical protein